MPGLYAEMKRGTDTMQQLNDSHERMNDLFRQVEAGVLDPASAYEAVCHLLQDSMLRFENHRAGRALGLIDQSRSLGTI